MLEWLKEILGDSYTEEIDKKVSAEIGKAFVAKGDFDAKNTEAKSLRSQLAEANKTIEGFKAIKSLLNGDTLRASKDPDKEQVLPPSSGSAGTRPALSAHEAGTMLLPGTPDLRKSRPGVFVALPLRFPLPVRRQGVAFLPALRYSGCS